MFGEITMRAQKFLLLALAGLLLLACAGKGPKYTPQMVDQAAAAGRLGVLYEQVRAEVQQHPRDKQLRQTLDQVRQRLAAEWVARIRHDLDAARLEGGFVPMTAIEALQEDATRLAQVDAEKGKTMMSVLVAERTNTQKMADLQHRLMGDESLSLVDRHKAASRWSSLLGSEAARAEFAAFHDKVVGRLYKLGMEAMDAQDYERARKLFESVREMAPDYPNLEQRFAQIEAGQSNQSFTELLEAGKVESAFQLLVAAAEKPGFDTFRRDAVPMAQLMLDYFEKQGAQWARRGRWSEAFAAFTKAHDVYRLLGIADRGHFSRERPFLNKLWLSAQTVQKRGRDGHAYGLLKTLEFLNGAWPGLPATLAKVRDRVREQALTGVSLSAFEDLPGRPGIGAGVVSRVTKELLERLPMDVKVVERDQLESILQERSMARQKGADVLATADFFVEGRIVDAKVESSESKGSEKRRVATRHEWGPNPEWQRWKDGGREGDEPPRKANVPVFEDITVGVTEHRKVALMTVSFRVIDAATAKVVYTDTIRKTREVTGRTVDGVSIGEYVQPRKAANMPTDLELLDELSTEVARAVGDQLVQRFTNTDERLLKKAGELARLQNWLDAAEYQARAVILREDKGRVKSEEMDVLRDWSLRALK
jgi:curli biogenesis system outer membrane secretion channel CsgG